MNCIKTASLLQIWNGETCSTTDSKIKVMRLRRRAFGKRPYYRLNIRYASPKRALSSFTKRKKINLNFISYSISSISGKSDLLYKNTIREENKMKNEFNKVARQLDRRLGFSLSIQKYIDGLIEMCLTKAKSYIGIEMRMSTEQQVKVATQWIAQYDPKFEYHIANADEDKLNRTPVIDKRYVVKIGDGAFIYVDGSPEMFNGDYRTLILYIFGPNYRKYFKDLKQHTANSISSNSILYTISASGDDDRSYWTCTGGQLLARTMDTIFFNDGIKETILEHISKWLKNEKVYASRGLNFKTGILVYGMPGTGKSSLAVALANYLKCGLIQIEMSSFEKLNISEVTQAINADNQRYVILLDEIDIVFTSRENQSATDKQISNTSKLLSFLDSSQSPNNVVFIATTNYPDKLDAALLRKGRFDRMIKMDNFKNNAAKRMCKGFGLSDEETNSVLDTFEKDNINPAELQDKILKILKKKGDEVEENDMETDKEEK